MGTQHEEEDEQDPGKEAFPKLREQFAEMVKSFEYADVVEGRSVEQDTGDEKNS